MGLGVKCGVRKEVECESIRRIAENEMRVRVRV